MGVFLAKTEPGSAEGITWEKAGAEGAIEVHPMLAHALLAIPGEHFFIVEAKKVENEIKKVAKKVEAAVEAPAKADDTPAVDPAEVAEAVKEASPTKRRSAKE